MGKQKNQRADQRREIAEQIEPVYTRRAEGVKQPACSHSADNSYPDVSRNALFSFVDKPAAYETRRQTENYPHHK
jgi:hypothetical protein